MMALFLTFLKAFAVGGLICCVGQALLMHTKLTSARILVGYVTAGVILGFGYSLAVGAMRAVQEKGLLGAFTGGIVNTAAGISAAVMFGLLNALIFSPHMKGHN